MAKKNERKCHACSDVIKIKKQDVIYYKKLYYHKNCFIEYATKRSQANANYAKDWQIALDDIDTIEAQTKERLSGKRPPRPTDKLNDWLLDHYGLTVTPSQRFWSTVSNLANGDYRGKRCKPINIELLTEVWMWGQNNLDKIAAQNRAKGNGMEGELRLYYDLAILLKRIPDFLKWKDKQKAMEVEINREQEKTKIDYSRLGTICKTETKTEGLGDISDLLDEIF